MTSVLILLSGFDPGTYIIEDDGIPNNGIAQLRQPNGSVITFNIPTEFLTVTASAGRSVIFNLTESFGAADINVGSLTNSAENPDFIQIEAIAGAGDVLLVSNSTITETTHDAAPDIVASTTILSAATGIGTALNAIETQVQVLEAETGTGGINLLNIGNLVVGGLTDNVFGLDVATSGDLTLVNFGSLSFNEASPGGLESVHGGATSGSISLIANGFDADISSTVDQDFITAPGGSILLQAGRDVSIGTVGVNFDNDVRARGNLTITAGRDVNVDGFADLASDGFGAATGGDVFINAGRDIGVLNSAGTDASIGAEGSAGGDVFLNTGPGGLVRLLASSTAALFSNSGNVNVNADRLVLSATAGITASSGFVAIAPRTAGWGVNLGSATDAAFALEISDAELDRVFTSTLLLGNTSSGPVTVSAALTPAAATNLLVRSETNINVNASVTTLGSLTLSASDNVFQLAVSVINSTSLTVVADAVNSDPGVGGIAILNGTSTANAAILGNADHDSLNGTAGIDSIFGLAGNDVLRGGGGNDILDGGLNEDMMFGGLGDDTYVVDNVNDQVSEQVGEGFDTVFTTVNYRTSANVDRISAFDTASTTALILTGNGLGNELIGNNGVNVLDGDGGVDIMTGLGGDDIYIVDNAGDFINESPGGGLDTVFTTVNYTIGTNVERLFIFDAAGVAGINITGNGLDNEMVGNAGVNVVDGGVGADLLKGLGGNDVYVIDNINDVVVELGGGGTDIIYTSVTYTLGANVERLAVNGAATTFAINLTGNGLDNELLGNNGVNMLDGSSGADTMTGLGGNDLYFVDNAADVINEGGGGGLDTALTSVNYTLGAEVERLFVNGTTTTFAVNLTGNALANELTGNDGANVLNGGLGADVLFGRGGADAFAFTTALGGGNVDQILDFQVGLDAFRLDDAVFAGLSPGALPAGAFRSGAAAGDADDRIIYDPATGALSFDADGNGAGAQILFANLSSGLSLLAVDFTIV